MASWAKFPVVRGHTLNSHFGFRDSGIWLSAILFFASFAPVLDYFAVTKGATGAEAVVALVVWVGLLILKRSWHVIDSAIVLLFFWFALSGLTNGIPFQAVALQFALLSSPFAAMRLAMGSEVLGRVCIRRSIFFLALLQFAMIVQQTIWRTGIDDLKGSFIGTHWGEHVAPFIILISAVSYATVEPHRWKRFGVVVVGFLVAYVGDSKITMVYFLGLAIAFFAIGNYSIKRLSRHFLAFRVGAVLIGALILSLLYVGAFGNIALSGYVKSMASTGGGKVAVAQLLLDPASRFWESENILVGAGPSQTVSRAASLTVPNGANPTPPAASLGIPEAEYFSLFQNEASSHGYVPSSSATQVPSSLLGILGDLGLGGTVIYIFGFFAVGREIARLGGWRSWPVLAWLGLIPLGLIGVWLEFPVATIFLATVAWWSATGIAARRDRLTADAEVSNLEDRSDDRE